MISPLVIVGGLLVLGVALMARAGVHLRRRRPMAASRSGLGAGATLAVGGLAAALAVNLYTYQRLTFEQPVAHLRFEALGPAEYRLTLAMPDERARRFVLRGDGWRLEARVLKWRGWANLLGFDSVYRLQRVAGRYRDVAAARRQPPTVYRLAGADRSLSVWRAVRWAERWLPLVDTRFGSATYMPMADGAIFAVAATQSGLVARPGNAAARAAVADWGG